MLKGNRTLEFQRYQPDRDSWAGMPPIPAGAKPVKEGGALCSDGSQHVYALKGAKTREFYVYDVGDSASPWSRLADVPALSSSGIYKGSCLAFAEPGGKPYVYCLVGGKKTGTSKAHEFWRYAVEGDTWERLQPLPAEAGKCWSGTALAWVEDEQIFCLVGNAKGNYPNFYSYDVGTDEWQQRARLGAAVKAKDGGALCYVPADRALYATNATKSTVRDPWRYDIDGQTWVNVSQVPDGGNSGTRAKLRKGTSLSSAAGVVFLLRGNKTYDLYRYVVNSCMDSTPEYVPDPRPLERSPAKVKTFPDCAGPRWSPDGSMLAYTAVDTATGFAAIYVTRVDSGMTWKLTDLAAECDAPQWSPEGKRVVFQVCVPDSNDTQIATVDLLGNSTLLTSEPVEHEMPRFSVDGTNIIYLREGSYGTVQIWCVPDSGGAEVQLTTGTGDRDWPVPYWATGENGAVPAILHQAEDEDGYWQLHALLLGGSTTDEQLTVEASDHEHPARLRQTQGPSFIVYERSGKESKSSELWLLSESLGTEEPLFTDQGSDVAYPCISDDGDWVCVARSGKGIGELVKVATDGSDSAYTITEVEGDYAVPQYAPKGEVLVTEYSPFGSGGGQQSSGAAGLNAVRLVAVGPNPARGRVTFRYLLAQAGLVSLRVYDTSGRLVRDMSPGLCLPGRYSAVWDGTDGHGRTCNGIFYLRLASGRRADTRKVVLTGR